GEPFSRTCLIPSRTSDNRPIGNRRWRTRARNRSAIRGPLSVMRDPWSELETGNWKLGTGNWKLELNYSHRPIIPVLIVLAPASVGAARNYAQFPYVSWHTS